MSLSLCDGAFFDFGLSFFFIFFVLRLDHALLPDTALRPERALKADTGLPDDLLEGESSRFTLCTLWNQVYDATS